MSEQLPPFGTFQKCPKCQSDRPSFVVWHEGTRAGRRFTPAGSEVAVLETPEYMSLKCPLCSYYWQEAPADAQVAV